MNEQVAIFVRKQISSKKSRIQVTFLLQMRFVDEVVAMHRLLMKVELFHFQIYDHASLKKS